MLQNGKEIEGQKNGAEKTIILGFEGRFGRDEDVQWKLVHMP